LFGMLVSLLISRRQQATPYVLLRHQDDGQRSRIVAVDLDVQRAGPGNATMPHEDGVPVCESCIGVPSGQRMPNPTHVLYKLLYAVHHLAQLLLLADAGIAGCRRVLLRARC
jgi:hypothetical protein